MQAAAGYRDGATLQQQESSSEKFFFFCSLETCVSGEEAKQTLRHGLNEQKQRGVVNEPLKVRNSSSITVFVGLWCVQGHGFPISISLNVQND